MKYYHQAYQREEDDQRVRAFLSQCYTVSHHPYYSVDPPNWERIRAGSSKDSDKQSIRLWQNVEGPSKKLVGLVVYQKQQAEYSCLVHPDYQEIEDMLCGWVEREHDQAMIKQTAKALLKCSVCERNEGQKTILTRRGYTKGRLGTLLRKRSLDGIVAGPLLPPGYTVQNVRELSGGQLAERAEVESKVFSKSITVEFLQELQRASIYQSELDMVITTPAGDIATFCTIWFDDGIHVGFIEPIGTVSEHRQRGLAKALMIEGYRRLQKFGAENVYLGHSACNIAANHLYESVEMTVFDQEYLWQKRF
jgi:ribosomal protein S18 acetylase RimI-like enzyme